MSREVETSDPSAVLDAMEEDVKVEIVEEKTLAEKKKEWVLMDAIHESTFDLWEFRRQCLVHTFWPLSLLWYPKSRWPQGAMNQFLLPRRAGFRATFWHSTPMLCWIMLALYLTRPERFDAELVSIHSLFTIPFILATSRTVLIAIKYATLSKTERHRFFTETDPKVVMRWLLQTQLISGWLSQRDDILRSELCGASSRLDIDLDHLYFVVEPHRSTACESTRIASYTAWEHLARSSSLHLKEDEFFATPGAPQPSRRSEYLKKFGESFDPDDLDYDPDDVNPDDDFDDTVAADADDSGEKKKSSWSRRHALWTTLKAVRELSKEKRKRRPAEDEKWRGKLPEAFETRHIRCELVIEVLLRAARSKAPIITGNQGLLFGLTLALLPRILAVAVEEDLAAFFGARSGPALFFPHRKTHKSQNDHPDWIVLGCIVVSFAVTMMVAMVYLIFLSVNVCHYFRMYMVHRWLALLIRASFESHPKFPQIQLCGASRFGGHNVLAWLKCRSIMCFFGKRYENRLDAYMLMVSFLAVVAVVVPFLRLLQAGGFGGNGDDDDLQNKLDRMKESSFLWTSLCLFCVTAAMLTTTVVFAANANLELDKALGSLTHHRLRLHSLSVDDQLPVATDDPPPYEEAPPTRTTSVREFIDDFEDTLQLAKDELDVLNRIHVLKVLGHPAEIPFALSIATTSMTVAGYVVAAVFGLLL